MASRVLRKEIPMSTIDLEPSAANCYNGYICDPTCDECATKCLACNKECYERRTSIEERRERCAECEFREYIKPFTFLYSHL